MTIPRIGPIEGGEDYLGISPPFISPSPPPIPLVCSLASVQFLNATATVNEYSPKIDTPAAPSFSGKSILIAVLALHGWNDYLGADLIVISPWTLIGGNLHTGDITYNKDLSAAVYLPYVSGSPTPVVFSWGGVYTRLGNGWIAFVAIRTDAIAPLQKIDTPNGFGLTLPNPLTPGNLLIFTNEYAPVINSPPDARGWTQVYNETRPLGDIGDKNIQIWSHCIGVGESSTLSPNGSSSATAMTLSEWQITGYQP